MGTFIYSPILYNWYKWLDNKFPGTTKRIIVRKLLLDQFILTPPLLVIFYTGMSLMERQKNITEECQKKFLPTFQRSCLFWLPAQTVNFLLIPPQYRVVYMGIASFLWVNILCYVKRQKLVSLQEKSN
jgi:Mpv17-like protein